MHKITVAICTYRRYELLEKCLESLKNQTQPLSDFRIIIVDNSLQPKEGAIFRDHIQGFPCLDYYITNQAGIAFARTFAVEHTDTEYIAFIDDDSIANKDWVEKIIKAINRHKPNLGAVGGKVLPIWTLEKPDWLPESMLGTLAIIDWGDQECNIDESYGNWLVSTNIAYNVEAVKSIHGFRKELGRNQGNMVCHEELDLHNRLKKAGYNIIYCPELIVNHRVHENRINKDFMCDLMFSEGYSRGIMEELEGDYFKDTFSTFDRLFPPKNAAFDYLFTDTDDPNVFKRKMIAISRLGRLLYHSQRVIERAPDWCFIPKKEDALKAKRNEEEFIKSNNGEIFPLRDNLTVNGTLPQVIKRNCDFINGIWLVIPCLNAANTIEETLNSIFSQQGDFTLYLHIQDGESTDGTLEIIKKWQEESKAKKNPRVVMTIDSSKDTGIYDAINKGFEQFDVPDDGFMTWLNADDILNAGTLSTVIEIAKNLHYTHWICGNRSTMTNEGKIIWESKVCDCLRYNILHGICDNTHNTYVQQEGTFWRGWLWRQVGGLNNKLNLAGDYDLWIRFAKVAELFPINRVMAVFRFRNGSLSSNKEAYSAEVDSIVSYSERDKFHNQLIRLLSEGNIMLSPVIECDTQNNSVSIVWKNSIENAPSLKDELRSYHQHLIDPDTENSKTKNSNSKRFSHKESSMKIKRIPQLHLLSESKWIGSKLWIKIYLYYWNKKQAKCIRNSELFNESWYLNSNLDVKYAKVDPALHYIIFGAQEGRNPSSDFDTLFYLTNYLDVKNSKLNPLYHYIKYGEKENRSINKIDQVIKSPDYTNSQDYNSILDHQYLNDYENTGKDIIKKIKLFVKDLKMYKTIYSSGLFFPTYYSQQNPDVINANINPLWHYIKNGDKEGRKPNPLFDPLWYRSTYPDIAIHKELNTLIHYYKFGSNEGRDPSPSFSTNKYLSNNLNINTKKINPLAHFILHAIREERKF
jgi:GT2 family glycosyltransferase